MTAFELLPHSAAILRVSWFPAQPLFYVIRSRRSKLRLWRHATHRLPSLFSVFYVYSASHSIEKRFFRPRPSQLVLPSKPAGKA
jgi:hypothetical protein